MTDQWIIVNRWDEFQHRDMARSTIPPWIKNLSRLLNDDDYLNLSLSQRGMLHGIWLLYASHRRVLSEAQARHKLVTSAAEARHWQDNIEALNHAGYILLVAGRPARHLASEPASLEVEVEKEGFKRPLGANPKPAEFVAKVANDPRGREHRPYDPPKDPATHIERLIANGAIPDHETLDAELAAHGINGTTADRLRELIPPSPIDRS